MTYKEEDEDYFDVMYTYYANKGEYVDEYSIELL